MIVVRCAVPAMDSNVHRVCAGHEAQAVNHEPHLSVTAEFVRLGPFDIGVCAVTADPIRAEQCRRRKQSPSEDVERARASE